jgi:GDP-D-mannose dehydratase
MLVYAIYVMEFVTCTTTLDLLGTKPIILPNYESFFRPVDFVAGKIANGATVISLGLGSDLTFGKTDLAKDWSVASYIVEGLVQIRTQDFFGDLFLSHLILTSLQDIIKEAFVYVGITNWQDCVK